MSPVRPCRTSSIACPRGCAAALVLQRAALAGHRVAVHLHARPVVAAVVAVERGGALVDRQDARLADDRLVLMSPTASGLPAHGGEGGVHRVGHRRDVHLARAVLAEVQLEVGEAQGLGRLRAGLDGDDRQHAQEQADHGQERAQSCGRGCPAPPMMSAERNRPESRIMPSPPRAPVGPVDVSTPSFRDSTRCILAAWAWSCVTRIRPQPRSVAARRASMTRLPVSVSSAPVGSSASSRLGLAHEGPGDRDPLLLAAGELRRALLGQVRDADLVERLQHAGAAVPARQPALPVDQGHRHVLRGGEVLEQEEALEDEAELGAAQGGGLALGDAGQVAAVQR